MLTAFYEAAATIDTWGRAVLDHPVRAARWLFAPHHRLVAVWLFATVEIADAMVQYASSAVGLGWAVFSVLVTFVVTLTFNVERRRVDTAPPLMMVGPSIYLAGYRGILFAIWTFEFLFLGLSPGADEVSAVVSGFVSLVCLHLVYERDDHPSLRDAVRQLFHAPTPAGVS